MPSQKPSPHRFIAPPTHPTTPKPKPKSTLRHALTATPNTVEALQANKLTPLKRFVVAPQPHIHVTDATPDATPRLKRKLERVESIEEPASSPPRATDDAEHAVPSMEHVYAFAETRSDNEEEEMLFVSAPREKVGRRTTPPLHHSSAYTAPESLTSHRFRPPPSATALSTPPTVSRPHFLPPPRSPANPQTPTAHVFSPSRRGQKYTPHGLASTMQALILDAAQSAPAPSRAAALYRRDREDGMRLKIRVVSVGGGEEVPCWAGGVVFVQAEVVDDARADKRAVRVLLSGLGGKGAAGVLVRGGSLVAIRAPTWEVDVGGELWVVGVDWAVLPSTDDS